MVKWIDVKEGVEGNLEEAKGWEGDKMGYSRIFYDIPGEAWRYGGEEVEEWI